MVSDLVCGLVWTTIESTSIFDISPKSLRSNVFVKWSMCWVILECVCKMIYVVGNAWKTHEECIVSQHRGGSEADLSLICISIRATSALPFIHCKSFNWLITKSPSWIQWNSKYRHVYTMSKKIPITNGQRTQKRNHQRQPINSTVHKTWNDTDCIPSP